MFCTYCGQEFSRAEHLERHVLTHSNVKPYKCTTCHASFGRQDLLQRHILHIHQESNESTDLDIGPFPRPIACFSCAKAKIKCDKGVPACGRCTSKGLQCQPRTSQHSTEAVQQTKRKVEAYGKSSLGTSSGSGENSIGNAGTPGRLQVDEDATDRDHSESRSNSPQPNSRDSPTRRRTRNNLSASSNDALARDHNPDQIEHVHGPQGGTQHLLSQGMPLIQDISMDRYSGSALEGYQDNDDHRFLLDDGPFDMDFSDMSNYMSFDATDTNMFQSPLLLANPLAADPTLVHNTNGSGSSTYGQLAPSVGFEGWPCFLCNPSSGEKVHPKTGRLFLQGLEHTLKNQDTMQPSRFLSARDGEYPEYDGKIIVMPFRGRTRDKLMVITQSILQKARKIHGSSAQEKSEIHQHRLPDTSTSVEIFSILPSTDDLEHLLQAHVDRFEPYYASVPSRSMSPTEILESREERCSSILLLLMLAQGAMAIPTDEARYLTSGLTEACRLSWFSLVERDVSLSTNPTMLRSALLFMNLAAWSGDKWHMDLAAAQLGVYLSMLRHSNLLAYRELDRRQEGGEIAADWKQWKEYECGNRLAYSWVVVDQELSLFHDMPSKLPIAELNAAMPDQDILWRSRSAEEWSRAYNGIYSSPKASVPKNPPSLKDIFRRFMNRDPQIHALDFSPTQLRLFLHPLQAMVCHLHECLDCFLDGGNDRQSQRLITQLEEVQSILQNWYTMCSRSIGKTGAFDPVTCANLVVYHLISLNTMTYFREMESLARGELQQQDFQHTYWARVRCVEEASRIWFHCGQVIRLVRVMPTAQKPPWWPAAIYRVAIIMWATSYANMNGQQPPPTSGRGLADDTFKIDGLTPEHPSVLRYLRYREGIPLLSKRDGGSLSLKVPGDTVKHCLGVLSEEPATTKLAEGIHSALTRFLARQHETRGS